jgi:hypothetical protein
MLISNSSDASQWGFKLPVSNKHACQRVAASSAYIHDIHFPTTVNNQTKDGLKPVVSTQLF